jgi:hypothetical protein
MNVPFVLGWPGTILYVGGMLSLLLRVLRDSSIGSNLFLSACLGITIGALGQMIFINTLIGVQGMVFWCFLGVCLAGGGNQPKSRPAAMRNRTVLNPAMPATVALPAT